MHEHIFVKNPELEANYPNPEWDEEGMYTLALAGLQSIADRGISTIVDLTVMGLGRSIPRIQRVAAASPVNIVVGTGYYTQIALPAYFHNHGPGLYGDMPEPLVDMFVRDITVGIADTGVRAAIIKVVTDKAGFTGDIERVIACDGLKCLVFTNSREDLLTAFYLCLGNCRLFCRAVRRHGLVGQRAVVACGLQMDGIRADAVELATQPPGQGASGVGIEQLELDARAAGVEHQDRHGHGGVPPRLGII